MLPLPFFPGKSAFFLCWLAFGGLVDCDHVAQIDVVVHVVAGMADVFFKDRKEDQGCDTGGESAVVEHETAVEGTGGGAEGGAEHSCRDTCDAAVAAYNGTETGGKGDTVDVGLGGDSPGGITSDEVIERLASAFL